MIRCKVLVQLTVEVEREFYGDYEQNMRAMFASVASDARSEVRRTLGDRFAIHADPVVRTILTDEVEVTLPTELKPSS